MTESPAPAKVAEAPAPEKKVEPENLLEKAKLISDLASAWQNPELATMIRSLPNGDQIFDIFSAAMNREMSAIMTGKRQDDKAMLEPLSKQVEQMAAAMSNFHHMIINFMQTPLVQTLNHLNQKLGGAFHDAPPRRQAPAQQQSEDNGQPSSGRRADPDATAPGLGSF